MIYAIYIAAAAVIGILIGLTTLSVAVLQKNVTKNIRGRTKDLIAAYDMLLEKKSRELTALQQNMEALRAEEKGKPAVAEVTAVPSLENREITGSVLKTVEQIGTTVYRDSSAGNLYAEIKENFSYDLKDVARQHAAQSEAKGPAASLLDSLSFDMVYEMSSLPAEQQIEILKETLPCEGKQMLEEYLKKKKTFRMLDFYDAIKAAAWKEPQPTQIHVSPAAAKNWENTSGVEVIADNSICEGYQVEKNHVLHDFSIRTRELS